MLHCTLSALQKYHSFVTAGSPQRLWASLVFEDIRCSVPDFRKLRSVCVGEAVLRLLFWVLGISPVGEKVTLLEGKQHLVRKEPHDS